MEGSLIQSWRRRKKGEIKSARRRRTKEGGRGAEEGRDDGNERRRTNLSINEPSSTVSSSLTVPRTLVVSVVPIHVRIQTSSTFGRRRSSNAALSTLRREEGGDDR